MPVNFTPVSSISKAEFTYLDVLKSVIITWKKLSTCGVEVSLPHSIQRRIILSNQISMVHAALLACLSLIMLVVLRWYMPAFLLLLAFSHSISILVLNKYGKINLSRISLCIIVPAFILVGSTLSKTVSGEKMEIVDYFAPRLSILCSVLLPLTLFDIWQKRYIFSGIAWVAFCLLFINTFHRIVHVAPEQVGYQFENYFLMEITGICCMVFLSCGFLFQQHLAIKYENKVSSLLENLETTNRMLADKNAELENAAEELLTSNQAIYQQHCQIEYQHEWLKEINAELVKAHQEIEDKNQKLQVYNKALEGQVNERTYELIKANVRLISANQELNTFMYRASHDLMGPLASMRGLNNLARQATQESETAKYLAHSEQCINSLQERLTNLIHVMSLKEVTVDKTPVHIQEAIAEVWQKIAVAHQTMHIQFKAKIPDTLVLITDKHLFQLILENLLVNAVRFASSKSDTAAYIQVEAMPVSSGYKIQIRDNSMAFPEEVSASVFDMFYRGAERAAGAGLGLYLAKKATEKLEGEIVVESIPSTKETVFSVTLTL